MVPERGDAPRFDIVAIASSAGGLTALTAVLAGLPDSFAAGVVVVQHLDPRHRSLLAEILSRRTRLNVSAATEGAVIRPGHVYVAPPDHHLLVDRGTMTLSQAELVHFTRPSADLLFESVAASYSTRAIAVVLTGTGVDGATGVTAIKKRGGTVIVQDEATSQFFGMPAAAIKTGDVDFVLSLEEIGPALSVLVSGDPAD